LIIATNNDWQDEQEPNTYVDFYVYNSYVYWYELETHLVKLNLSITEAAICTKQRVERDNFYEKRHTTTSIHNGR
jgi:hypothetical protein